MNRARAMLDALMGPGRDVVEKDESSAKQKFKDRSVCKGFLIGLCPLDASLLGGKRSFNVCGKIHSEIMRDQLKAHEDGEKLTRDYECISLQDLEYVVRECEAHISTERQRIRTDVRRKKPPLPPAVNDKLAAMKRESSAMIQKAESMDDDQMREKEALITKANELQKDRDDMLEIERKKAAEGLDPEEVCEVCGTSYIGKDGDAAHLKFRIHDSYVKVRERIAELKPRVEEGEKKRREKKDEELKKKRKEEWDKAAEKEKDKDKDGEKKDGDKKNTKDGDGEEDAKGKKSKERSRSRKKRSGSGDQDRKKNREKGRSRSRSRRRGKSRSPSSKKPRKGRRSRSRGRDDKRVKRRASSGSRSRSRNRGRR